MRELKRLLSVLPVSLRRHLLFLRAFGRWGNFRSPVGYSEKLSWRAINDRRPIIRFTADKLAAKTYVRQLALLQRIPVRIPETYWVGTDVRELASLADRLPSRWVLKPNHSFGRVLLVDRDVQEVDWTRLLRETKDWIDVEHGELFRGHWAYGEARRLLIAEERIGSGSTAPDDLKIESYGGEPAFIFHTTGRHEGKMRYSNIKLDGTQLIWGHPSEGPAPSSQAIDLIDPVVRERAIALARVVSAPFDQLRVDGYEVAGEYWFGELTSYPAAGLGAISDETDRWLGSLWHLPDLRLVDPREHEWRALIDGTPRGTLQATSGTD